jgi:hypothetical protein
MEWSAVGAHAHAHPDFIPVSIQHPVAHKDFNEHGVPHPFENWDSQHYGLKHGYAIADSVEHCIDQRDCIRDIFGSRGVTDNQPSPAGSVHDCNSLPFSNLDANVYSSCAIKDFFPDAYLNADTDTVIDIDHSH